MESSQKLPHKISTFQKQGVLHCSLGAGKQIWENPRRPPPIQIFNSNSMKKVTIAFMVLMFNLLLFSCSDDSLAETDALYETQATEGDDGNPPPPPPPPGGGGN